MYGNCTISSVVDTCLLLKKKIILFKKKHLNSYIYPEIMRILSAILKHDFGLETKM